MPKIFICYRRADAEGFAGRIYDRLCKAFDEDQIFMDVKIRPGEDFVAAIEREVGSCDAFLPVIGKIWLQAKNENGQMRLQDKFDFVRLEIAAALSRSNITVIPVLVGGASMPQQRELPEGIELLARRQALELRSRHFNTDFELLTEALKDLKTPLRQPRGQRIMLPKNLLGQQVNLKPGEYRRFWLTPCGNYLYAAKKRDQIGKDFHYDLNCISIQTGETTTLSNIGTDDQSGAFNGNQFYKGVDPDGLGKNRVLCFSGTQGPKSPYFGPPSVDRYWIANGQLWLKCGQNWHALDSSGKLKNIPFLNGVDLRWAHSSKNIALLESRNEHIENAYKQDSSAPRAFKLVRFNNSFQEFKTILELFEKNDQRYGWFTYYTKSTLLFAESIDTNQDGLVNYKDKQNSTIKVMNLDTGYISNLMDRRFTLYGLIGGPKGLVFLCDQIERKLHYRIHLYDNEEKAIYQSVDLKGGYFRRFQFSDDWSKLIFSKVTDARLKGKYYPLKGKYYPWENEVYLVRTI